MVRLNPTLQKKVRIRKSWIYLSLLIVLVLPAVFIVGSSSGAATFARGMGGLRLKGFVTLQDPGEPGSENELAKGKFLVASQRLSLV